MPLAILTFITGLAISAVAIYYSVIGLAAIFAAAVVPIMIMGAILEIGKLVAAWWLKWNWYRAPFLLKSYMLLAVIVLMLITSMGIFGFLSKAHTEQSVPVGDNQSRIQIIDERIAIQQEVIEQARREIDVLNQQIERFTELGAVTRGVNVRNDQRAEREALTNQIAAAQDTISELRLERAPFAASLRAIEAEVGPIKYIAKLIYGDNADQNLLEKAVVWVIIVIVFVFDPLAVLLLLASQLSFQWARQEKLAAQSQAVEESKQESLQPEEVKVEDSTAENNKTKQKEPLKDSPHTPGWVFTTPLSETVVAAKKIQTAEETPIEDLEPKIIVDELSTFIEEDDTITDSDILNEASDSEKAAMQAWKKDHPETCLKTQKLLYKKGLISKLPWENYLDSKIDLGDNEAAVEAARWAQEQIEASKKKDSNLDGDSGRQADQKDSFRIEGYVQNEEQSDSTIWQRVKKVKDNE